MKKIILSFILCIVGTLCFCANSNTYSNDTIYYDSFGNLVIEEYCDVCDCTIRTVYYEFPDMNSTSSFSVPWFEGVKCSDYNDCIYFDGGYIKTTCTYMRKKC